MAIGIAELDIDQALVRSVAREKHHSFKCIKHQLTDDGPANIDMSDNRNTSGAANGVEDADSACRSVGYAAGPAPRLMHKHIKPIHPYLDVGFSLSRRHARGSERGSQAVKLYRCVDWRTQKTCAGWLHIDPKTQHSRFPQCSFAASSVDRRYNDPSQQCHQR